MGRTTTCSTRTSPRSRPRCDGSWDPSRNVDVAPSTRGQMTIRYQRRCSPGTVCGALQTVRHLDRTSTERPMRRTALLSLVLAAAPTLLAAQATTVQLE